MNISIKSLTEAQIEQIHEMSLKLLSEHGIEMNEEVALETFKAHGAKVDGKQVYIPREMVEDALKSVPSSFTVHARDPKKSHTISIDGSPALTSSAGVPMVLDETGVQRSATFDDYRLMQKLIQTSPVLNYGCTGCLFPAVSEPYDGVMMMLYYALSMTDKPFAASSDDIRIASAMVDLLHITTGYDFDKHMGVGIANSLSPMAWDKKMLDGIRIFAEHNQPINISCCAMAGATSPVYMSGAILQANTEVLAGLVYSQLIRPGTPVIYGTTSSVMDMGAMSLALGTPEYVLISSGCCQMAHHYGLPFRSAGGLNDAKELDAQAGMESAMNLTFGLCEGVNFMLQGTGILESYMAVGFDKWIMDEEIMMRVQYIRNGISEIPEDLPEIIADGTAAGNYLGEMSTITEFRNEFYWPQITDRRNFTQWKAGGDNYRARAWQKVKERAESYVCPELSPEVKKDLEAYLVKTMGHDLPNW